MQGHPAWPPQPLLGAFPQTPIFIFFLVARKKTEAKERARKRPELGGRLHIFPNLLRLLSCNLRLNVDSEKSTVSKDLLVRNVFVKT